VVIGEHRGGTEHEQQEACTNNAGRPARHGPIRSPAAIPPVGAPGHDGTVPPEAPEAMGDSADGAWDQVRYGPAWGRVMRVVAGSARGRVLVAPPGLATRPTADRVREAVFNALHSLGVLEGADVVDCFAGSGALGIEALSRGAAHVTFTEPDAAARRAINENLTVAGAADRADVRPQTAERLLADAATAGHRFDLVLLDPPYGFEEWRGLLAAVGEVVAVDGVVVMESDRAITVPVETGLEVTRSRRYGSTVVTFARPPGVDS
jgi:16S rRNA (guanine966-N2)-methyltransferase